MSRGSLSLLIALALVGCTTEAALEPEGPVATSLADAARAAAVPADLLLALAIVEDGVRLPARRVPVGDDAVPVAGALELRHGRLDTLAWGARLVGASEDALRADTELGTRAGALVLAALGRATGADPARLETWHAALAALSGLADADAAAYADEVLALLRTGAAVDAASGERLVLAPHPGLPRLAKVAGKRAAGTPDFPGAIWFETSCTNKCTPGRPDGVAAVDTIVIHDTEGGWNASVATLQNDAGKSVHYIVDADGSRVGQFIHESDTAYHAGNFVYNKHSIGIEHVGFVDTPYDERLYATSRAVVRSVRERWTVPLDRAHIIGHYQVPNGTMQPEGSPPCSDALAACEADVRYGGASHHTDPGVTWQWCAYLAALGGSCACADTQPTWTCSSDGTQAVRCAGGAVEQMACSGGCVASGSAGVDDDCRGAAPLPDAGPEPDAPLAPVDVGGGGGCSCRAAPGGANAASGALLGGLAVALLAARRRRR